LRYISCLSVVLFAGIDCSTGWLHAPSKSFSYSLHCSNDCPSLVEYISEPAESLCPVDLAESTGDLIIALELVVGSNTADRGLELPDIDDIGLSTG